MLFSGAFGVFVSVGGKVFVGGRIFFFGVIFSVNRELGGFFSFV